MSNTASRSAVLKFSRRLLLVQLYPYYSHFGLAACPATDTAAGQIHSLPFSVLNDILNSTVREVALQTTVTKAQQRIQNTQAELSEIRTFRFGREEQKRFVPVDATAAVSPH
jgi:hypothetical protein